MTDDRLIHKCPICGGSLQATVETYTNGVILERDGSVLDWGSDCGVDGDSRYYCENDHTSEQITAALESHQNQ